jgi:hypothetical protein
MSAYFCGITDDGSSRKAFDGGEVGDGVAAVARL